MEKQKVIRTYPKGWSHTTGLLQAAMDKGYRVVMCNKIIFDKDNTEVLEYIVEKEENCNAST